MTVDCRLFLLLALVPIVGCSELPAIPANTCGNAVVEVGEDCDTFAPPGQQCGAAGPGRVGQCRYLCSSIASGSTDAGVIQCPQGAACGTDGICRFSLDESGKKQYQSWGEVLPMSVERVRLGDFDGDGRQDLLTLGATSLLQQALPQVTFLDKTGARPSLAAAASVFALELPVSMPSIGRLDQRSNHRGQQIVFAATGGIETVEAESGGGVQAVAYPNLSYPSEMTIRLRRIRGGANQPLDNVLEIGSQQSSTEVRIADSGLLLAHLDQSVDKLAGEPIAADVVEGSTSPCEELLVAFRGEDHVSLFEPCGEHGTWNQGTSFRPVVHLPGGHTVDTSIVTGDANGDDHLDVLVGDETGAAHLAFGRGDGTFMGNPADVATIGVAWPVTLKQASTCILQVPWYTTWPLAAGDLNGDKLADWVSPEGIFLSQGPPVPTSAGQQEISTCIINGPFVRQWSAARIADLNRDGLPDVVAGSSHESDLDFFVGAGGGVLTWARIATRGRIGKMVTGDFDGDRTLDLAFTEQETTRADQPPPTSDRLIIAFGALEASAALRKQVNAGEFASGIKQLEAARYASQDGAEEIGVVALSEDRTSEQVSIFVGNSGRHPIAPLGLTAPLSNPEGDPETVSGGFVSGYPLAATIVRVGKDGPPGVLATTVQHLVDMPQYVFRLWLVPAHANGRLGVPKPSKLLPAEVVAYDAERGVLCAYLVTGGDVDGDGTQDALMLAACPREGTTSLWKVNLPATWDGWGDGEPVTLLSTGPGSPARASAPALIDLNGDGRADLVMVYELTTGVARLGVVWNTDNTLRLDTIQPIKLDDTPARAFASAVDRGQTRLVAITDTAAYEIAPGTMEATRLPLPDDQPIPGGSGIALGDVTGDGLLDVVVAEAGGVRIYAEIPRNP